MKASIKTALANAGLFNALAQEDKERLGALLRPRSFRPDEIIFQQGEEGHCLYLIQRGRVKICVLDPEGLELIFTFLSKGDILGELAILDGRPRSATAIAVENTDTLYIDRKEFLCFLNSSPAACIGIISVLCNRLRETDRHLEEISFLDVAGRLARKLMEVVAARNGSDSPEADTWEIGQEELARIVGASRVIVNKILNSFVDLGLITIARRRLTILNTHELSRLARYESNGIADFTPVGDI